MKSLKRRRWAWLLLPLVLATMPQLIAQTSLERSHYKYETVADVYRAMIGAISDGRTPPDLLVEPAGDQSSRFVGAWINWTDMTITVEEELYDVCVSLGRDSLAALAFTLGHELAHFYKDHRWHRDFLSMGSDLEIAEHISGSARNGSAVLETEADYFGIITAYIAGYDVRHVGTSFFDAFYDHYQIPDDLPGYPSKRDRAGILSNARPALESLALVFDAGNLLLTLGAHEEAARCFDHIGRKFPSREVINNAGVARALGALALFDPAMMPWTFPFEFDATTRLRAPVVVGRGGEETNEARRLRLLDEARSAFQRALSLDERYAVARLNLACIEALRGEYRDAEYHLHTATKHAVDQGLMQTAADCRRAQSILSSLVANTPPRSVSRAEDHTALAGRLLAATGGEECIEKPSVRHERIGAASVGDYTILREISPQATVLPQALASSSALEVRALRDSTLDGFAVIVGDRAVVVHHISTSGHSTARNVSIGDDVDAVLSSYGCPTAVVSTTLGVWCVYEQAGIAFVYDARGKVQAWNVFSELAFR